MTNKKINKVGIIGGLGPLASASFVETIYTTFLRDDALNEHYHSPYVYLYSEPLLSQSTVLMSVSQSKVELLAKLEKNTAQLLDQDVDCIFICCFTAHALLPQLSLINQAKICSLVTPVFEHVMTQSAGFIVLCASSARAARVFESHPLWLKSATQITFLEDDAQKQLDLLIQMVKNNLVDSNVLDDFLEFMGQYSGCQFIIACAELHILHKKMITHSKEPVDYVFDPFYQMAQSIWGEIV